MRRSSMAAALASLAVCSGSLAAVHGAEKFFSIPIQRFANRQLTGNLGSGAENNNLSELPMGEQELDGVTFQIGPGLMQLGSSFLEDFPEKIEGIVVKRKFKKLHLLHATCYGRGKEDDSWYVKDGTTIGGYVLHYDDGTASEMPIVYGEDVRDWWFANGEAPPSRGKVAWSGENAVAAQSNAHVRLYLTTWDNPKPEKQVSRLDYVSRKSETAAAPFCLSISVQ